MLEFNNIEKIDNFRYIVHLSDGIDKDIFISRLQQMTNEIREEPAQEGEQVMLAGDPEILNAKIRLKEGIPLDENTVKGFEELSEKYNVPLNWL